ncbi:MAG TPA: sulfatase-like hydrolase/transferase [Pirellulales bacterium]|jgi:arylsulfatase A-like enzyme|nr:sulfatase-like hydrolase/transferase [Pirellulales bacterium]
MCRRCATLAGIAVLALVCRADGAPRRPNFIVMIADDQRWDAFGVVQREQGVNARFPFVATPNLDRLAGEGFRFRNMFCVNSLCSPSRASILTGCYGYRNGVVNNHTDFPANNVTCATLLRQAGYTTGFVGKWHMGEQTGPRPGFDYSASYVGQGIYFNCPFQMNGQPTKTTGWVDDVSIGYATDFIRQNADQPFLLMVGFKTSHEPFQPREKDSNLYRGERARSVPNLGVQAIYARDEYFRPTTDLPPKVPVDLDYFRTLTDLDQAVGRLLTTLDDLRLADDTMIFYCADNGFYLGEHNLVDKRSAYDESLRIPMLVRYPRIAGGGKTIDGMALNIDVAPTILDYAGVPIPPSMQGRSWRPLLEGNAENWRESFFYAYYYEATFDIPMVTAVRTTKAKLIRYPAQPEWTEVFDLEADPYEVHNLVDDPGSAELRKKLELEYFTQAKAIGFQVPSYADDPKNDLPPPGLDKWVLEYNFDQSPEPIDRSGSNNNGKNVGPAHTGPGRPGHAARNFASDGYIEVPNSKTLAPAVMGWTVEVTFKAEKPDGVVFARGGASNGYCLYLDKGRPIWTVVGQGHRSSLYIPLIVTNKWLTLTASMTDDHRMRVLFNGQETSVGRLGNYILSDPMESMQIGYDAGSPVAPLKQVPAFVGLIESFRIHNGPLP